MYFCKQEQDLTNMLRSTRKKSKTGICHLMLRVNTEFPVHYRMNQSPRDLRQMADKLIEGHRAFRGEAEQVDDITVMCVRRL